MATKSIFKNVDITDKQSAKQFVEALENAQYEHSQTVEYSRTVSEAKGEEIQKLIGENLKGG